MRAPGEPRLASILPHDRRTPIVRAALLFVLGSVLSVGNAATPAPDSDWLDAFRRGTTAVEPATPLFPATLEVSYPGRRGDRSIVRIAVAAPWRELAAGDEIDSLRFLVDGELFRRDEPFDSFRYRLAVPRSAAVENTAPIVFERHLAPGRYSLVLRIACLDAHRVHRVERAIEVPIVAAGPESPTGSTGDHSLTLLPPPKGLLTGKLRVAARASGDRIDKVRFELDDRPLMSKRRPPWSVEIDLGRAPRLHDLRAVALDEAGRELASDHIRLNTGPSHFEVRLV
ncbi:MAG: hypothetical protein R3244_06495, partial [Thermoanaerobaculia bacterium]|nr:hypothetical protein [Thermoanaerobaculia bacterium]